MLATVRLPPIEGQAGRKGNHPRDQYRPVTETENSGLETGGGKDHCRSQKQAETKEPMQIFPRLEGRFAEFVAPARQRSELWRLGLSGILIGIGFFAGTTITGLLTFLLFGKAVAEQVMSTGGLGTTPASIIFILSGFAIVFLAVWGIVRLVHRRSLRTLFGASPRRIAGNALIACAVMAAITGLGTIYSFLAAGPEQNLPFGVWLGWMIPVLPLMLVQVTTEEIIFRGYLQQQLAARFRSPWVWMVLPSVIFGSLHYQPGVMGDNALIAVLVTVLVGVFAADITARTGNIGAAIGLHFVNNFFAMCFLSLKGGLSGVSLYVTPFSVADSGPLRPLLLADAASIALLYGVYLFIVNRMRRH
jgi:membrane protease YdiL (CAAX protease family)